MTEEEKFLLTIKESKNPEAMMIFADWLAERGRNVEAAQWRAKAGDSRVVYRVYVGERYAEYRTVGACNRLINRMSPHRRKLAVIRVYEYRMNEVGTIQWKPPKRYLSQSDLEHGERLLPGTSETSDVLRIHQEGDED